MTQHTYLYSEHCKANAKFTDFAGYVMPLHYGSQLQEHQRVRENAGLFDVSHMGVIDITGHSAAKFLRHVLSNDVAKIAPGQALYTLLLNAAGGIIDDLIVYQLTPTHFRLVVNAANKHSDLAWLQAHNNSETTLLLQDDLAILALQGPQIFYYLQQVLAPEFFSAVEHLKTFTCKMVDVCMIANTGYTGEKGVEIILPVKAAARWWQQLIAHGVTPCGLGARDSLRLEAGLPLYGHEMSIETFPNDVGLQFAVDSHDTARNFIGKQALQAHQSSTQLCGILLAQGILRAEQVLYFADGQQARITSGGYSPTLKLAVGLARVPRRVQLPCHVAIRGNLLPVTVVRPPFVRRGQAVYRLLQEQNHESY